MNRRARLAITTTLFALLHSAGADALSSAAARRLQSVADELAASQVERAAEELRPLKDRYGSDPQVLRIDALIRLHQGDYSGATESIERSLEVRPPSQDDDREELRDLMRSTRDTTASYIDVRSGNGRFIVRHAPGRDARLVPYALRALQRADRAMTQELGLELAGPIRLEIYPNARTLASVSTLTEEAIERTGTIALCKWDRLMVTSPRALLRGYPWMDTISHEFVHLVLTRASRDRAPVWFSGRGRKIPRNAVAARSRDCSSATLRGRVVGAGRRKRLADSFRTAAPVHCTAAISARCGAGIRASFDFYRAVLRPVWTRGATARDLQHGQRRGCPRGTGLGGVAHLG